MFLSYSVWKAGVWSTGWRQESVCFTVGTPIYWAWMNPLIPIKGRSRGSIKPGKIAKQMISLHKGSLVRVETKLNQTKPTYFNLRNSIQSDRRTMCSIRSRSCAIRSRLCPPIVTNQVSEMLSCVGFLYWILFYSYVLFCHHRQYCRCATHSTIRTPCRP